MRTVTVTEKKREKNEVTKKKSDEEGDDSSEKCLVVENPRRKVVGFEDEDIVILFYSDERVESINGRNVGLGSVNNLKGILKGGRKDGWKENSYKRNSYVEMKELRHIRNIRRNTRRKLLNRVLFRRAFIERVHIA